MPTTSTVPEDPPAHTLESLAEKLGPADPDLEAALLEGATDAALVRVGRSVASSRLVTDEKRLYSTAYDVLENATDEQRENLRGLSHELLAIAVARALKLAAMAEAHEARAGADGTSREAREAAARAAFTAGLSMRDQAANVIRGVAGPNEALIAKVDAAVRTAESGEVLAKGLTALADVGKQLLAQKKGPVHARAKLMRLDAAYVASLEAAAKRVSDTAAQAGAKSGGTAVTQGALDREDGVNARILGHLIEVFETAHDIDPTIPRLVPIATRRLFGKHKKIVKTDEDTKDDAAAKDDVEPTDAG